MSAPIQVMFVCLGNICRSPLAQGIFEDLARKAGLSQYFCVASSGVGAWHVGEKPDVRMRNTARQNGISLDSQQAQQLVRTDLEHYDHIYAMDRSIERDVLLMDRSGGHQEKVQLFSKFDPDPNTHEVPDPYFEGNFDLVFTIVDRTCRVILDTLVQRYGLSHRV